MRYVTTTRDLLVHRLVGPGNAVGDYKIGDLCEGRNNSRQKLLCPSFLAWFVPGWMTGGDERLDGVAPTGPQHHRLERAPEGHHYPDAGRRLGGVRRVPAERSCRVALHQ